MIQLETLEQLAIEYAFIDLDVRPQTTPLHVITIRMSPDEAACDALLLQMQTKFGCYETQEAIKEATMAVKLLGLEKKDDGHGDY